MTFFQSMGSKIYMTNQRQKAGVIRDKMTFNDEKFSAERQKKGKILSVGIQIVARGMPTTKTMNVGIELQQFIRAGVHPLTGRSFDDAKRLNHEYKLYNPL